MHQYNMDLSILQETKITGGVYSQDSVEFSAIASEELIPHRGSVEIFYKDLLCFTVEAHQ